MPLAPCYRYYYTHGAYKGKHHHRHHHLPSNSGLWGSPSSFLSHSSMLHCGGAHRQYSTHSITETKSKKMLYYLTAVVFGMVGLTYAVVQLYRTFCQATGYGGTVQRKETVEEKIARHSESGTVTERSLFPSLTTIFIYVLVVNLAYCTCLYKYREIVVQFNADVSDGMQWKFTPSQREVRVKPGESVLAFYTAENKSSSPITGVSTYNVTPMKAGVYFNKIQCFCYEEQRLLPGEPIDLPVFFYIDPEFETDPRMDGINNLIFSYTFFKVSEETTTDSNSYVPVQETN